MAEHWPLLPIELVHMVCFFLDFKSLITLTRVSRSWHQLITTLPQWNINPIEDYGVEKEESVLADVSSSRYHLWTQSPLFRVFMLNEEMLEYSLTQNAWHTFPHTSTACPIPKSNSDDDIDVHRFAGDMCAAIWEGKAYVFGYEKTWLFGSIQRQCVVFDPLQHAISPLAPLTSGAVDSSTPCGGVDGFGMGQHEGIVYTYGGYDIQHRTTDVMQRYHIALDRWEMLTHVHMPEKVACIGSATLNGEMYSIGGIVYFNGTQVTPATYIFNTRTEQWRKAAPLNKARYNIRAVALHGQIFVLSWCSSNMGAIEKYDPRMNKWDLVATLAEMPTQLVPVFVAKGGLYAVLHRTGNMVKFDPYTNACEYLKPSGIQVEVTSSFLAFTWHV